MNNEATGPAMAPEMEADLLARFTMHLMKIPNEVIAHSDDRHILYIMYLAGLRDGIVMANGVFNANT